MNQGILLGSSPVVSFVIATHNRREILNATLARLDTCGLPAGDREIIVVDNASTDGTADSIAWPQANVLHMRRNRGSCAKAYAADIAKGRFIVFLDDDSYPLEGSIERMIEKFDRDEKLGAAGFTVTLPDGRHEASALPGVFIGCGVGFRADAYRAVGGLDRTFFMQAEEYDLAFRLVNAGWTVDVFDDLHVLHLKAKQARRTERTSFLDARNNLRLVARHLPQPFYRIYRHDWLERYQWLAENDGHLEAFRKGVRAGRTLAESERPALAGRRLKQRAFERFFQWEAIDRRMVALREDGATRIVLAGLAKNLFAFYRAAQRAGIRPVAVADDGFSRPGRRYRELAVVTSADALKKNHDAVVVCEMAPSRARELEARWKSNTDRPVHAWYNGAHTPIACPKEEASHQMSRQKVDNNLSESPRSAVY